MQAVIYEMGEDLIRTKVMTPQGENIGIQEFRVDGKNLYSVSHSPLADPGGARDARFLPQGPKSFIFMQLSGKKNCKIIGWESVPPPQASFGSVTAHYEGFCLTKRDLLPYWSTRNQRYQIESGLC